LDPTSLVDGQPAVTAVDVSYKERQHGCYAHRGWVRNPGQQKPERSENIEILPISSVCLLNSDYIPSLESIVHHAFVTFVEHLWDTGTS
jgi:hypothetical protein